VSAVLDAPSEISPGAAFLAVLWRDVFVTGRELPTFLAQVILQPLLLLFVFGRILTELGFARAGYAHLLFPGVVAMTVVLTSLQSTALSLVIEFSFTKEIEDRLMAPLPVTFVAIEKMIFAAMRGVTAGLVMFPIGVLVLGSIPFRAAGLATAAAALVLGAITGSTLGLTLGTLVPPQRINITFALVMTPLLFTGCSQYPWPSLVRLRWFQVVTTLNPMTYVSEAMRASLVPGVAHMNTTVCFIAIFAAIGIFGTIGIRDFLRRAID